MGRLVELSTVFMYHLLEVLGLLHPRFPRARAQSKTLRQSDRSVDTIVGLSLRLPAFSTVRRPTQNTENSIEGPGPSKYPADTT